MWRRGSFATRIDVSWNRSNNIARDLATSLQSLGFLNTVFGESSACFVLSQVKHVMCNQGSLRKVAYTYVLSKGFTKESHYGQMGLWFILSASGCKSPAVKVLWKGPFVCCCCTVCLTQHLQIVKTKRTKIFKCFFAKRKGDSVLTRSVLDVVEPVHQRLYRRSPAGRVLWLSWKSEIARAFDRRKNRKEDADGEQPYKFRTAGKRQSLQVVNFMRCNNASFFRERHSNQKQTSLILLVNISWIMRCLVTASTYVVRERFTSSAVTGLVCSEA